MSAYYNEHDPKAAAWLRELIAAGEIAPGEVDERSICDVAAGDLLGFTQCHFFAGIGGWSRALRLAGISDHEPVWTGSCPCQPFSAAGAGLGTDDERHLWPEFYRLIRACRPGLIFGEQVASAAVIGSSAKPTRRKPLATPEQVWLDGVFADLEAAQYACGAADFPAASLGAPHVRQRLYWIAYSAGDGFQGLQRCAATQIPQDGPSQALASWNTPGDPFADWPKLLASAGVRKLDDGVSSNVVVRPALRAFGNAILPDQAAEFIRASLDAITSQSI